MLNLAPQGRKGKKQEEGKKTSKQITTTTKHKKTENQKTEKTRNQTKTKTIKWKKGHIYHEADLVYLITIWHNETDLTLLFFALLYNT